MQKIETSWDKRKRNSEATVKQNEATIRAYAKEVEKLRKQIMFLKATVRSLGGPA